ncbi:MAG: hypothetical protein BWZ06_01937 [Bacteroidetes bacterium ADurb.BinA261]|nr:MAG: hypothetical protein BWZ06_01937 [Bacteroidetes bacterium ADurb.BinA261]
MCSRGRFTSTRKNKTVESWQFFVEPVDFGFNFRNIILRNNTGYFWRDRFCFGSQIGTNCKQFVLYERQQKSLCFVVLHFTSEPTDKTIQFVHCAIGIEADMRFFNSCATYQRCCTRVTRFSINQALFHLRKIRYFSDEIV